VAARAVTWPAIHLCRPASGSRLSRCCSLRLSGAATMILFHAPSAAPHSDARRARLLSGLVAYVVVAPLLVGLVKVWRLLPPSKEWIEGVGLGLTALACSDTMTQKTGSRPSFNPSAIAPPLLLWLMARCQPAFGIAGASSGPVRARGGSAR
jgi:hypothetical protein